MNHKIQNLEITEERFEPRYPIELAKAGEYGSKAYFSSGGFGSGRASTVSRRLAVLRHGWRYTIQCAYCSRQFKRMRRNTILKPHKDQYGNNCYGRRGVVVGQQWV
jgi:hypothetical protein